MTPLKYIRQNYGADDVIYYAATDEIIKLYNQYSDYIPYNLIPATNMLNHVEIESLGNPLRILRGGIISPDTVLEQSGNWFIGPPAKCKGQVVVKDDAIILSTCSIDGHVYIMDNSRIINSIITAWKSSKINIMGYTNLENVSIACYTSTTLYNTNICCNVNFNSTIRLCLIINNAMPILDININDDNYFEYLKIFTDHKKPYGAWVDDSKHNYCILMVDNRLSCSITILLDDLIK